MVYFTNNKFYDSYRGPGENRNQYWIDKNYQGWEKIVRPLVDYCVKKGYEILQIKAKFGSLCFHLIYDEKAIALTMDNDGDHRDEVLHKMVCDAEDKSWITCCECGAEDDRVMLNKGICETCKQGWIDKVAKDVGGV